MAGFAILAVVAFWVTNAACRQRSRSRRRPSYWFAVFGAFGAVLGMVLVIYNRALFTSHFWREIWDDDRLPAVNFVPLFLGFCLVVALIPALLVVRHHRGRFR